MAEKQNVNAQENIARLQMLEQNVQAVAVQRQQMQSQLLEIESALKELRTSQTAFKIVGNIMISAEKSALEKDLNQKKELIDVRVKNLEKQEKQFKDKTKQLQEEVLKALKKE
ncbi:prefoldin subunit beta [Candidatus Woesearchaeota archaeon]|nr:prefoldin subunit beta [Candidatus Woesearchaeota archaeon]